MMRTPARRSSTAEFGPATATVGYQLEEQIGHLLRKAHQRATAIFTSCFGPYRLTPTQWTALVRIYERGGASQNHLGRLTALDPATMQGVVQRLTQRGLIRRTLDPEDGRRKRLALTQSGERVVRSLVSDAFKVSRETLRPLTKAERTQLLKLLSRIC